VLSARAQKTKESLEAKDINPLTLQPGRLCLALRECGLDLPWDKETAFLEDVAEIQRHAREM
jgi:hypothetical protein